MTDAFRTLGLSTSATADEVRQARRELAKQHHPDTGGDPDRMRAINEAAGIALRTLASPPPAAPDTAPNTASAASRHANSAPTPDPGDTGITRDVPSFTVEALPVETFEALLVVTSWIGEVIDDDPPYRLDVLLHEHGPVEHTCWCCLELVPDAGASTVSISVGAYEDEPVPPITTVRDVWIAQLNRYDWD